MAENEQQPIPEQPTAEAPKKTPEVKLEIVTIVGPCGETPCGSTFGTNGKPKKVS
jgi:hypothetical protein